MFVEIAECASFALDSVAVLVQEGLDERLMALETMLAKVGALADESIRLSGGEPFRGDAFAWLMSQGSGRPALDAASRPSASSVPASRGAAA